MMIGAVTWYVKQGVPPGLGRMLFKSASAFVGSFGGGVFHAIALRERTPAAMSHVYSTYTMLPSPLMSPNIFKTFPVDPFAMPAKPGVTPGAGEMTPLPNAPCTTITVPAACPFPKHALICAGGPGVTDQSGTVSRAGPSNVVISAYDAGTAPAVAHSPLAELTP